MTYELSGNGDIVDVFNQYVLVFSFSGICDVYQQDLEFEWFKSFDLGTQIYDAKSTSEDLIVACQSSIKIFNQELYLVQSIQLPSPGWSIATIDDSSFVFTTSDFMALMTKQGNKFHVENKAKQVFTTCVNHMMLMKEGQN